MRTFQTSIAAASLLLLCQGCGEGEDSSLPISASPAPTPTPVPTPSPTTSPNPTEEVVAFVENPLRQPFTVFSTGEFELRYEAEKAEYQARVNGGDWRTVIDDLNLQKDTYVLSTNTPEERVAIRIQPSENVHSAIGYWGDLNVFAVGESGAGATPPNLLADFKGTSMGLSIQEENCWGPSQLPVSGLFTGLESDAFTARGQIFLGLNADCDINYMLPAPIFSGSFEGGKFTGRFETDTEGENYVEIHTVGANSDEIVGRWKYPMVINGTVKYFTGVLIAKRTN